MTRDIWVIEARKDGKLLFDCPQPESFFGMPAIQGITEEFMAKRIFAAKPDATLTGDNIPYWPALINENWVARRKTW